MLGDKDYKAVRKGNKEAFRKLFCHYYPRLKAYVATILNDDTIAEDIVQDAFLYVWEHPAELPKENDFRSYLYRLVYTRSIDYIRRMQVKDQYYTLVYEEYAKECEALLEGEGETLEKLYTKDFYQELYELLQQIPKPRREVFLLAYIEGRKAREIAEQLNLPQRTVESHLYLTLKYLKEHMDKRHFVLLLLLSLPF